MSNKNNIQEFWNNLYKKRNKIWSGNANQPLVDVVTNLTPGTALDLGCGEGGDAVWLAKKGWHVLASDVSDVAMLRTGRLAKEHNVEDKIDLLQCEFEINFPEGVFDLVSAQYLQSPLDLDRAKILQKAAQAVEPNGLLIIAEHASAPSWSDHKDHKFPLLQETYDTLQLNEDEWQIIKLETPERETVSPYGEPATIKDNLIVLKRLAK